MANTLATPSWVLKEVARGFTNDVKFLANVNRTYDSQYKVSGACVGNTVNARLPQRFEVTDGQGLQLQNLFDQTVPITLTNQKNVAFGYSSAQATTELNDIRTRYTKPGGEAMANAADVLAYGQVVRDVYSSIGTPGTTPSTPKESRTPRRSAPHPWDVSHATPANPPWPAAGPSKQPAIPPRQPGTISSGGT